MKVNGLTVGPIIKGTEGTSVRIWGRGEYKPVSRKDKRPKRCLGVIRVRAKGAQVFQKPQFFKMNPNFDMTGVAILDGLREEKEYDYQIGYVFSNLDLVSGMSKLALEWSKASRGRVKTASMNGKQPRSIIFGSCRNLLLLFGLSWYDNRGDKTFLSMLKQIKAGNPVDDLLMIGDQIYADDLNFLKQDETLDQFNRRYQLAFSQPFIRELMACVPTYMTLDDHEIEDNWPTKATKKDWITKYPAAIHAYMTYQASGSPLFSVNAQKRKLEGVPEKLSYTFRDGCCDFFVLDTRTDRDSAVNEIISREQLDDLKTWLTDSSGRVKLIVSAVPFFPDHKTESPDKWGGFLGQRTELLDLVRDNKIKRVVFLSGDVHCSMTAELVSPSNPGFKIISIISSAFFWPYSHPKASKFHLAGQLPCSGPRDYTLTNVGPIDATDNFTRLQVDLNGVKAEVYARKGEHLRTRVHSF